MKKLIALLLVVAMVFTLAACHDSSQKTNIKETDYDPVAAAAPYVGNLMEMTEDDKNYVIEMGYNDINFHNLFRQINSYIKNKLPKENENYKSLLEKTSLM